MKTETPMNAHTPDTVTTKRSARSGKKFIGGYYHPDTHKAMKRLGADEGATTQALVAEALTLLFDRYRIEVKVIEAE